MYRVIIWQSTGDIHIRCHWFDISHLASYSILMVNLFLHFNIDRLISRTIRCILCWTYAWFFIQWELMRAFIHSFKINIRIRNSECRRGRFASASTYTARLLPYPILHLHYHCCVFWITLYMVKWLNKNLSLVAYGCSDHFQIFILLLQGCEWISKLLCLRMSKVLVSCSTKLRDTAELS